MNSKFQLINKLNSDDYFIYTKEDYKEYLEWKFTLSDYELKNGFRFVYSIDDCESYEPTFSWYMKNRNYLKRYYERINDYRKLKPNQFLILEKPKVNTIDYNEWNW